MEWETGNNPFPGTVDTIPVQQIHVYSPQPLDYPNNQIKPLRTAEKLNAFLKRVFAYLGYRASKSYLEECAVGCWIRMEIQLSFFFCYFSLPSATSNIKFGLPFPSQVTAHSSPFQNIAMLSEHWIFASDFVLCILCIISRDKRGGLRIKLELFTHSPNALFFF